VRRCIRRARMSVASSSLLRDSALAVFREATKLSRAERNRARNAATERTRKAFASIFAKQGRAYLARLPKIAKLFVSNEVTEAAYDGDLADAFADVFSTTRKQAEKALFESMFDGITGGYQGLASDFGLETSFKLKPEQATKWARDNAAKEVTKINEATQIEMRGLITRGIDEGRDYGSIAREIRDTFDGFTTQRAELVAVQENAMAYEEGQSRLVGEIEKAGITMEKAITGPDDDLTSDICRDAMDMGWIDTDEEFPGGEQTAPLHVGCRHATIYRVKEEE